MLSLGKLSLPDSYPTVFVLCVASGLYSLLWCSPLCHVFMFVAQPGMITKLFTTGQPAWNLTSFRSTKLLFYYLSISAVVIPRNYRRDQQIYESHIYCELLPSSVQMSGSIQIRIRGEHKRLVQCCAGVIGHVKSHGYSR